MRVFSRFFIALALFFILNSYAVVHAVYDPRSVPNNQFGIHIVDPSDIHGVRELINSNGGEWGYVKVVIPETDRNTSKWDSIFRELRRQKLIPIVRIATRVNGPAWVAPTEESIADWPEFLNSLSWPVQNRYVVLFNEPNHANEWGGSINPQEFGRITIQLAKSLKEASSDYFILPAGLDVSAGGDTKSMDAATFLARVVEAHPEFLSVLDGWNSHSYPNPAFSSPPSKTGRGSLYSFRWEQSLLKTLGLSKDLPILIGETGWVHQEGTINNPSMLSSERVAEYYKTAGETVWKDPSIFAVVPFIYNYQGEPFAHFSFRRFGGDGYYPQYFSYQSLKKQAGVPKQREAYQLLDDPIPKKLIAGSFYTVPIEIKNTGQAILSDQNKYYVSIEEPTGSFLFNANSIPIIEPDQSGKTSITLQSPVTPGTYEIKISIKQFDNVFDLGFATITVLPPPTLTLTAQLGWQKTSEASQAAVLVYDGDTLIFKFDQLPVKDGLIVTPGVLGIVPERSYRIVTLVPYYLPRQIIQPINAQVTFVKNKRFLPLDADNNQRFDVEDIKKLILSQPWTILPRFFNK